MPTLSVLSENAGFRLRGRRHHFCRSGLDRLGLSAESASRPLLLFFLRFRSRFRSHCPSCSSLTCPPCFIIFLGMQGFAAAATFINGHFISRQVDLPSLLKFEQPYKVLKSSVLRYGLSLPVGRSASFLFAIFRPQSRERSSLRFHSADLSIVVRFARRLIKESGRDSDNPYFVVAYYSDDIKLGEGFGRSMPMASHRVRRVSSRRSYAFFAPANSPFHFSSSLFPSFIFLSTSSSRTPLSSPPGRHQRPTNPLSRLRTPPRPLHRHPPNLPPHRLAQPYHACYRAEVPRSCSARRGERDADVLVGTRAGWLAGPGSEEGGGGEGGGDEDGEEEGWQFIGGTGGGEGGGEADEGGEGEGWENRAEGAVGFIEG